MTVATTISELLAHVDDLRASTTSRGLVFRGERRADWSLLPRAGRKGFVDQPWELRFQAWSRRASEIKRLPANEWRQLALAQHHGLATPLLDWSTNPLVAAYFAARPCPPEEDSDGVVYTFSWAVAWDPTKEGGRPKDVKTVLGLGGGRMPFPVLQLPPFSDRMRAQAGVFTIHGDDTKCMRDLDWPYDHETTDRGPLRESVVAIRIPAANKPRLLAELASLQVSHSKLFPDLDGVSDEVNSSHNRAGCWQASPPNQPLQRTRRRRRAGERH